MAANEHYDLIVRNATIIDGTRAPRFHGEIGVRGDRIVKIGALDDASADTEIDALGPDRGARFHRRAHARRPPALVRSATWRRRRARASPPWSPAIAASASRTRRANGAPTPPLDLLDGSGDWFKFPTFRAYREELEAHPAAINATCLVGHTTFRVATMDRLDRAATPAEIAKMRAMAHESLASGAIGVSTGTAYPPAACAPTEEIIESLPAADRIRRALRHAHAQRGRPRHRVDRGDLPDRPRRSKCRS